MKMDGLLKILGSQFPPLLVMEYLPGSEYTVDVLKTEKYTIIPIKRNVIRSGITFEGTVVLNEQLINYSKKLSEKIDLNFAFGYQFKSDENNVPKLLEANPRVQGTMVLSTFAGANIIYGAVKYAKGENVPDFKIHWGAKIFRYWGGIGICNDNIVAIL